MSTCCTLKPITSINITSETVQHNNYKISQKNTKRKQNTNRVLISHVPATANTLLHKLVKNNKNKNKKQKQKTESEKSFLVNRSQDEPHTYSLNLHLSLSPDIHNTMCSL